TLCRALVEEVRAAARLQRIELPAALADDTLQLSAGLNNLRTSMLQDLEAGRPTEVDSLYVGTLRRLGPPAAPAHQAIVALLEAAERALRGSARRESSAAARRFRP
ncbi:MAG: hypothetical protein L0Z62_18120, partial [Gemmataceae bacterium]|nr:hypothetical protein [Gemmataceae bacterium]